MNLNWKQFSDQVEKHLANRDKLPQDMLDAQAQDCITDFCNTLKTGQQAFGLFELAYHLQATYAELLAQSFDMPTAILLVEEGQPVKSVDENPIIVLGKLDSNLLSGFIGNALSGLQLQIPAQYVVMHPSGFVEFTYAFPNIGGNWTRATSEDIETTAEKDLRKIPQPEVVAYIPQPDRVSVSRPTGPAR